jgi:hypothetical protein
MIPDRALAACKALTDWYVRHEDVWFWPVLFVPLIPVFLLGSVLSDLRMVERPE